MGAAEARKRAGYAEALASVAVNTTLFALKYVVGTIHRSVAVVAAAFHTLSDSLTSLVVLLGVWLAHRPPDREHPFGHGRAEQLAALVVGAMLIIVGVEMTGESVGRLLSHEGMEPSWALVTVMLASALAKEALARWSEGLGRRYGLSSLLADAWHHRSDAVASAVLALAIALGGRLWWLDGALGIAVSLMILRVAIGLVIRTGRDLLGAAPPPEELRRLEEVVRKASGKVKDVHHVHVHRYGNHTEVTLHVRMDPSTSLGEAHEIATKVEDTIRREMGWEATVHVEPLGKRRSNGHHD